nr:hypothetical protein [Tanacetum cinerariifolium]
MAFRGNTCDLGSFGEDTDKITDLHQIHEEVLLTEDGDGVTGIKQRRRDPSSDGVRNAVTVSGHDDSVALVDGGENGFLNTFPSDIALGILSAIFSVSVQILQLLWMHLESKDSDLEEQQKQFLEQLMVDHQYNNHAYLRTIKPIHVKLVFEMLLLTEHNQEALLRPTPLPESPIQESLH